MNVPNQEDNDVLSDICRARLQKMSRVPGALIALQRGNARTILVILRFSVHLILHLVSHCR